SEYGKYCYDKNNNNCEHFANMVVLGINHSSQGLGLKPFTSRATVLKDEIKACEQNLDNLISSSNSRTQDLVREIKDLTKETSQESYGDWESRIEVETSG